MFLANEATTSAKRNKREEQYIALGMTKNTMKGTEKGSDSENRGEGGGVGVRPREEEIRRGTVQANKIKNSRIR